MLLVHSSPTVLLDALRSAPTDVFNQYAATHPLVDRSDAADRRLENLRRYLEAFVGVRYLLVGEAAGFRACRFTGVPFTDETQFVGGRELAWARETHGFRRTSQSERPLLREASATVVWDALGERRDVALWNVVPWHPPCRRGPFSNGLPSREARRAGLAVLTVALATVWPQAQPIAVGRVAEQALRELGVAEPRYLRHPGHGGAVAFKEGLARVLSQDPLGG